jgi:hypothetical protein
LRSDRPLSALRVETDPRDVGMAFAFDEHRLSTSGQPANASLCAR